MRLTEIGPAVPAFHELYPEIEVRLRLSDYMIDLAREGVEVAVRLAALDDSSLKMRKICECERVLCAAPAYLAKKGTPETPEALANHHCLLLRYPGSTQFRWPLQTQDGTIKLAVSGPFESDDGDTLTDWALSGHGIVMKPLFEVADHLRSGALHPILLETPPETVSLAILYPHRRLLAPKIKAFADFMQERCLKDLDQMLGGLSLMAAALKKTAPW